MFEGNDESNAKLHLPVKITQQILLHLVQYIVTICSLTYHPITTRLLAEDRDNILLSLESVDIGRTLITYTTANK